MSTTNQQNRAVSDLIGNALNLSFCDEELKLGKWGFTDNYCNLGTKSYLLLECEHQQKHPNTNVLKLFPYLEENDTVRILLFHYFFPQNKAPKSRQLLCEFIAKKMQQAFPERFHYIRLPAELNEVSNFLKHEGMELLKILDVRNSL